MRWEEVELPAPAAGEARIRHTAIAVNFSDINRRRGGFYTADPIFPTLGRGPHPVGRKQIKKLNNINVDLIEWCPRRDSNPHVLANIRF